MNKKLLWKSLPADMKPHGFQYKIGEWYKHTGELKLCFSGFHSSESVIDAMGFVNAEVIARVEVRGDSLKESDKQVWSEMKIVKAWKWKREDSISLAIFAAELVIDIFEKKYPNDKRPREAIEAAKRVLKNDTKENRAAAGAARVAADAADAARVAAGAARVAARAGIKLKCEKFVIERLRNCKEIEK